jgi:translation initiation factor 2 subunit 2
MMFLLAEMGTSGSLDGQQRLVIKGRFAPKNFEAILRRYISKLLLFHGSLAVLVLYCRYL